MVLQYWYALRDIESKALLQSVYGRSGRSGALQAELGDQRPPRLFIRELDARKAAAHWEAEHGHRLEVVTVQVTLLCGHIAELAA